MIWRYEDRAGDPAWCDVEIHERPDGKRVFLVTEICYNPARAVTHHPEMLANKLKDRYRLNPRALVWIERYPEHCRSTDKREWLGERYDLVNFRNGGAGCLRVVQVQRITKDQACALISSAVKPENCPEASAGTLTRIP